MKHNAQNGTNNREIITPKAYQIDNINAKKRIKEATPAIKITNINNERHVKQR
ncbi:14243_t:CDS:2 [Gigaspora margarita]|uniref:14243_t:CDS:1 n=1 Tax=Gigaspora margarita TaxID=4874 RepID=A0ABN7UNC7_GIGMA|nr:14243_t:CDS:2 [Gigaspora margarita]